MIGALDADDHRRRPRDSHPRAARLAAPPRQGAPAAGEKPKAEKPKKAEKAEDGGEAAPVKAAHEPGETTAKRSFPSRMRIRARSRG